MTDKSTIDPPVNPPIEWWRGYNGGHYIWVDDTTFGPLTDDEVEKLKPVLRDCLSKFVHRKDRKCTKKQALNG